MNSHDAERCFELRRKIFISAWKGGKAHLASSFSAVEIIYALYMKGIMKYDPKDPRWSGRDRFVLSKGHGALALYAVMGEAGIVPEGFIESYLAEGGIGGEPCSRDCAAIEATTGALGHGLPMAVGMAVAQRMDGAGAKTYVLLGDGECEEGSVWEAAMAASTHGLGNLTAIVDCNELQKAERVDKTIGLVNWKEKWEAFGWNVLEADGHDTDALAEALQSCGRGGRPTLLIARTVKGKGVSIMEGNARWHFKLPNKKELKVFMEELKISEEELK